MAPKYTLLNKVKIKEGLGYVDTYFVIQAIRYNSHVKMYMYYGTDSISAYEDELELII